MRKRIASLFVFILFCVANQSFGMEDPNSFTSRLNEECMKEILRYVQEGEKDIQDTAGKEVVVFLGPSQVGKSATINALRGARLSYTDDGKVVLDESDEAREKFAEMGVNGVSCTTFPKLYPANNQYAYLDTRGFGDVRSNREAEVAASILIEMATKKAKNVRIVVLEDYNNINKGVASSIQLGEAMGKIIVGHKLPVFFLFNRYAPPPHIAASFYRKSFEDQQKTINDSIKRAVSDVLKGKEQIAREIKDKNALKNFASYASILEYNLGQGNMGHIDPTCKDSINTLLTLLNQSKIVEKSSLVFNGYSTDRVQFDEAFAREIESLLFLMKSKMLVTKYTPRLLEELAEEAEQCAHHHDRTSRSISTILSSDTVEKITNAYTMDLTDVEKKRNSIWAESSKAYAQQSSLEAEILEIRSKSIKYWSDRWYLECGFFAGWWRNYTAHYPYSKKIARWSDHLRSGTSRDCIVEDNSYNLCIKYTSDFAYDCAGTLDVYVAADDDPSTVAVIRSKQGEIDAIKALIKANDKALEELDQLSMKDIKEKIESFKQLYVNQSKQLKQVIALRRQIDEQYHLQKDKIEISKSIIDKLESDKLVFKEFADFYSKFFKSIEEEKDELEALVCPISSNYLLDPVYVGCEGGDKHDPFERRSIIEWLQRQGSCPMCRKRVKTIKPVPFSKLNNLIASIHNNALQAESMFQKIA